MGLDQHIYAYPKEYRSFMKELVYYGKHWDLQHYMEEKYGYENAWHELQLTPQMIEDIMKNVNIFPNGDINDPDDEYYINEIRESWNEALEYSKNHHIMVMYCADW